MGRVVPLLATVALLSVAPLRGTAQDRWPVSIEANLGLGSGISTGIYGNRLVGPSGDALIGVGLAPRGDGRWFAAASFAVQSATGPVDDICQLGPDGSCLDRFPEFSSFAVLAGWETRSTRRRVLTGPAALRARGDWENIRFAWLTRLDAASAPLGRISLTASLRASVIPSYDQESFLLLALSVGLRVR